MSGKSRSISTSSTTSGITYDPSDLATELIDVELDKDYYSWNDEKKAVYCRDQLLLLHNKETAVTTYVTNILNSKNEKYMNCLHNKYRLMIDKYVHKYCMEIFDLYMTEKELRNEFNIVSTLVSVLKTDIRLAEETIITQGIAELRSYNGIFIKAYTNIIATITGNLLLIHKNSSKSTPSITSKPKHVISLGSIRGIEVNEYKRENKPTEYILFIAYDKTSSTNISSISDNSFDGERDVDFSTSLPSPSTNTRSISITAPTLTPMSVASPNCKTICIRILEQFDSIPNNHDSNFYHSFISSLSSLIPPSSNIIHKTNSNQNQLDCNSNNRSSSTEESGTNNEDLTVRGSTLTTATATSNQSHEFIGRNIARRNSFPPRNYTEIIKNVVIKPSSSACVAPFTNVTPKDRNSVFSTKLIKRGTFIGDSRSNASVAPGTESSDAVSNKSGKMITNLILLQEKLVFSREKRTLLQDELVLVITNRERAHEIFRLLSMFKRIVNCEDIEVMVTIERELSPFIGLNQDDKDASNIDRCISKMTSCSSIIRNHNTQRKVDQIVKLLVNIIENYREKMKFDAVLTRIFACREKLNELILSAQKNSLHEIVEKPNPNDLFEVDL